jgi:DNA-dependent RNA polymerase auxiliary subunit epsilon
MSAPLFIVPDSLYDPPKRYLVKDSNGNIRFITGLNDCNPEETAIMWAIKDGGWLRGLIFQGDIPSYDKVNPVILGFGVEKPLYVVLDVYGKRLNVTDDNGNVLFITTLQDKEPEQTATLAAMRLGGWLKGMVKSHKNIF